MSYKELILQRAQTNLTKNYNLTMSSDVELTFQLNFSSYLFQLNSFINHYFLPSIFHCIFLLIYLLSKYFCLQSFPPKDSVSLLFAQFIDSVGWSDGGHQMENVLEFGLQIIVKCIFLDFSWNLRVLLGVLKKS